MFNKFSLISNQDMLDAYKPIWRKNHPRAKKFPIDTPIHPSMNKWIKLPAFSQDGLKQAWKEYTIWLVKEHGYDNINIEKCFGIVKVYRPTKRRFDCDNISPKFFLDGVVETGMLKDDDTLHLNPLVLWGAYEKNNPHMIIEFYEYNSAEITDEMKSSNPLIALL